MPDVLTTPIRSDPAVVELLAILQGAKVEVPLQEFNGLLDNMSTMQDQLKTVSDTLLTVTQRLADIEERQKHPVGNFFKTMLSNLHTRFNELKAGIGELLKSFVEGVKRLLTAIKEKGITAANGIMQFFNVKDGLNDMQANLNDAIAASDKRIAKIDAMAAEVHEAGAHVKNIGRAAQGKEFVQKRENGRVAKAVQLPVKGIRAAQRKMRSAAAKMVVKLDGLEQSAARINEVKAEKKASVLGNLADNQAKIAEKAPAAPAPGRNKRLEATV